MSASEEAASALAPRARHLLSRYAESIVWFARYMERIENLARILDVTETFMRTGGGAHGWLSSVQINADEAAFFARHAKATPDNVLDFYVIDRDNPTSIVRMITAARENARTLRPLISTEMWAHINIFFNKVRALEPDDLAVSRVAGVCGMLRTESQTHTGITEGTFYRDQGWCFYALGKHMERADQTTRLVDIKYHTLLPANSPIGSPVDISQWNTMLRAAAGYHAFRRQTPRTMSPASVAGFILMNGGFPRSVTMCLQQIGWQLTQLRSEYGLQGSAAALERHDTLRAALADHTIEDVIVRGLHEFLDWVQCQLSALQTDIADGFWAG